MTESFDFVANHATRTAAIGILQRIEEISPGLAGMTAGANGPAGLPMLAPGACRLSDERREAIEDWTPGSATSRADVVAVRSGLFQLHDDLDRSHELAQSIEGRGMNSNGDYWHAIMHRREPDYGNSNYWFRRVGEHPIFAELASLADDVLSRCSDPEATTWRGRLCASGWDAAAFVDLCRHGAHNESAPLALAAREIQLLEMLLLLEATCRDATGNAAGSGP